MTIGLAVSMDNDKLNYTMLQILIQLYPIFIAIYCECLLILLVCLELSELRASIALSLQADYYDIFRNVVMITRPALIFLMKFLHHYSPLIIRKLKRRGL